MGDDYCVQPSHSNPTSYRDIPSRDQPPPTAKVHQQKRKSRSHSSGRSGSSGKKKRAAEKRRRDRSEDTSHSQSRTSGKSHKSSRQSSQSSRKSSQSSRPSSKTSKSTGRSSKSSKKSGKKPRSSKRSSKHRKSSKNKQKLRDVQKLQARLKKEHRSNQRKLLNGYKKQVKLDRYYVALNCLQCFLLLATAGYALYIYGEYRTVNIEFYLLQFMIEIILTGVVAVGACSPYYGIRLFVIGLYFCALVYDMFNVVVYHFSPSLEFWTCQTLTSDMTRDASCILPKVPLNRQTTCMAYTCLLIHLLVLGLNLVCLLFYGGSLDYYHYTSDGMTVLKRQQLIEERLRAIQRALDRHKRKSRKSKKSKSSKKSKKSKKSKALKVAKPEKQSSIAEMFDQARKDAPPGEAKQVISVTKEARVSKDKDGKYSAYGAAHTRSLRTLYEENGCNMEKVYYKSTVISPNVSGEPEATDYHHASTHVVNMEPSKALGHNLKGYNSITKMPPIQSHISSLKNKQTATGSTTTRTSEYIV